MQHLGTKSTTTIRLAHLNGNQNSLCRTRFNKKNDTKKKPIGKKDKQKRTEVNKKEPKIKEKKQEE